MLRHGLRYQGLPVDRQSEQVAVPGVAGIDGVAHHQGDGGFAIGDREGQAGGAGGGLPIHEDPRTAGIRCDGDQTFDPGWQSVFHDQPFESPASAVVVAVHHDQRRAPLADEELLGVTAAMEHHQDLEAVAFQRLGPDRQLEGQAGVGCRWGEGGGFKGVWAIGHGVMPEVQAGTVGMPCDLVGRGGPLEAQPEKQDHQHQRHVDADEPSSG